MIGPTSQRQNLQHLVSLWAGRWVLYIQTITLRNLGNFVTLQLHPEDVLGCYDPEAILVSVVKLEREANMACSQNHTSLALCMASWVIFFFLGGGGKNQ